MKQINYSALDKFEEYTISVIDSLKELTTYLRDHGRGPWTLRISLPRVSIDDIDRIIDHLTSVVREGYLVSVGTIDLRHLEEDLLEFIVSNGFLCFVAWYLR